MDLFSPITAAIGSATESIAKLIMINSEYCQKPIAIAKYPSGKYIVPYVTRSCEWIPRNF